MKLYAISAALAAALAAPVAMAQKTPAEVTDAQLKQYKATAEGGCVEAGTKRGDSPASVGQFCKCMMTTLEKNMTVAEWRQAVTYAAEGQAASEANVLGPHLNKLRDCRPTDAPADAKAKPKSK